MERRRFLTVVGTGALGSLGAVRFARSRQDSPEEAPADAVEIEPPWAGTQRVVWSVETNRRVAALTFDDGPDPAYTPRVLDILDRYGVKATFMALGHNAVKHASLLGEVMDAGHEIGGHGWRHLNLAETSPTDTMKEVEQGIHAVEDVVGRKIRVFRPPYGRFSEDAMKLLGHAGKDLVVWSVSRGDLAWTDPRRIATHVVRSLQAGGIVDLHDGLGRGTFFPEAEFVERLRRRRETELESLPQMIEGIGEKGLRLETVSELLAAGAAVDARA